MENNNFFKPASEKQINYLKSLGYEKETEGLTVQECSDLINEYALKKQPSSQPQQKVAPKVAPKETTPTNQVPATNQKYTITTALGNEIFLSKEMVDKYICKDLSEEEYTYFFAVCKNYSLNPYLKEIYPVKYGNQPATFIIDYKVLQQAIDREPLYDGMETGVLYLDKNGVEKERQGQFILEGEALIAAWCKIYRKDRSHSNKVYAPFSECVQLTKDGQPNKNWASKPVFMNVKVAKTWAIREAFPNWFSPNTYTSDEIITSEEFKRNDIDDVIEVQVDKTGTKNLYEDVMEDDNV